MNQRAPHLRIPRAYTPFNDLAPVAVYHAFDKLLIHVDNGFDFDSDWDAVGHSEARVKSFVPNGTHTGSLDAAILRAK
jgi:hypothetical protein